MSKNYAALAQSVVGALGGVDNITAVTHCMTRLRFRAICSLLRRLGNRNSP